MGRRTVVVMPGDGIGNTVLPESLRVLEAAGFEADWVNADIGWEFWKSEGNPLPQRTIDLIAEHKVALFGAITSKPKDAAAEEIDPALRDKGYVYYSPIVGLRQNFDLDVSIRPCITFPGNPLNFVRRGADGGMEEPLVNSVIFRQNTEGLYGGVEWTNPPDNVWRALDSHPRFTAFRDVPREGASELGEGDPESVGYAGQSALHVRHFRRQVERTVVFMVLVSDVEDAAAGDFLQPEISRDCTVRLLYVVGSPVGFVRRLLLLFGR